MLRRIGAEEGGEFKAVASGTLPSGKPVVVNSDGTVSVPTSTSSSVGSTVTFNSGSSEMKIGAAYDSNSNRVVIAYKDAANSNYGTAIVGTVSGTSISFGTAVVFLSGNNDDGGICFDSTNNKIVITTRDTTPSVDDGKAFVGTVSGTSISFGSAVTYETNNPGRNRVVFDSVSGKVAVLYSEGSSPYQARCRIGTVSGTSISFGTEANLSSNRLNNFEAAFNSDGKLVYAGYDVTNSLGKVLLGTISGTDISFSSETSLGVQAYPRATVYDSSNDKFLILYADASSSEALTGVVTTLSGTTFSFGTAVRINGSSNQSDMYVNGASYNALSGTIVAAFRDRDNSNQGTVVDITISGTSLTVGSETVFETGDTRFINTVYDSTAQKTVINFRDVDDSSYGKALVYSSASNNLTSENYIGMSRGVAGTDTRSEAIGSPTVFETGEPTSITTAYDSSNNRVVISYRDGGNNFYATTVVGTISGTSISFGTPVVFNSENSNGITNVFDSNAGKVVTLYLTSLGYPSAKVGTVSGTSISYGSATAIISSNAYYMFGATFDSTNNKVIVGHGSSGGANANVSVGTVSGTSISFGSAATTEGSYMGAMGFDSTNGKVVFALYTSSNGGRAYVGTVSGTSISFGSAVQFNSNIGDLAGVAHDPNSGKTVIGYRKGGGQAAAIVGTVSGTSISFGSETEVQTSNTTNVGMGFDSRVNKIIYAYRYGPSPYNGRLRVGTVSGTSISFDSEVTFESGETNSLSPTSIAFDSTENVVIIGYKDAGDSNKAKAVVYQAAGSFVNRAEVADGGNASMDIIGSVSDNQIGLTAGQQYYVQTDGTISTTAGSPSVLAGTAISATELVVKT